MQHIEVTQVTVASMLVGSLVPKPFPPPVFNASSMFHIGIDEILAVGTAWERGYAAYAVGFWTLQTDYYSYTLVTGCCDDVIKQLQ